MEEEVQTLRYAYVTVCLHECTHTIIILIILIIIIIIIKKKKKKLFRGV